MDGYILPITRDEVIGEVLRLDSLGWKRAEIAFWLFVPYSQVYKTLKAQAQCASTDN